MATSPPCRKSLEMWPMWPWRCRQRLRCVAKPEVFMCLMGGTRRVLAVRGVPKTNQHLHHFASFCIILHHFASFEKDLLCLAQCLAQCLAGVWLCFQFASIHRRSGICPGLHPGPLSPHPCDRTALFQTEPHLHCHI